MVGRAKSLAKKTQILSKIHSNLLKKAAAIRKADQERELQPGEKRKSLANVCTEVADEYFAETGKKEVLSTSTVDRLAKGGIPKAESNALKGWLLPEEVEVVIKYALDIAARGFPLSHKRLKEVVDDIVRARLGDKFPASGVGHNWTDRFLTKHSDRLKMYWTHSLDEKRGRAVNPVTNAAWFDLLQAVLQGKKDDEFDDLPEMDSGTFSDSDTVTDEDGMPGLTFDDGWDEVEDEEFSDDEDDMDYEDSDKPDLEFIDSDMPDIDITADFDMPDVDSDGEYERDAHNDMSQSIHEENLYGQDESGFQPSVGTKERVIGAVGKKTQHKLSDGGRENTTVIVTICADGTALKPAVIFKGQAYRVRWDQENPVEAS